MTEFDNFDKKKKELLIALEKSLGIVTNACKLVKITRQTFYNYYNEDKEFKQAVDQMNEVCLDYAETQLYKLIQEGNPAAIIFYMKTKGKTRGYIEKQEIDHSGDIPQVIFSAKVKDLLKNAGDAV